MYATELLIIGVVFVGASEEFGEEQLIPRDALDWSDEEARQALDIAWFECRLGENIRNMESQRLRRA